MALLQISEPGQSPQPHQRRQAVGIDLGTTNSLVASVRSGMAETLPDEQGRHLLPSVVHYASQGPSCVGNEAAEHNISDPLNTILSVKRLLGRGLEDVKMLGNQLPYDFQTDQGGMPKIATACGLVSPIQVSAEILRKLVSRAEVSLGGALDGAVITVPAYFDEAQRQATKDAATLAGVKVLRLLNEPTAAAIAYGLDNEKEGVIAVYDLGGGTFDVSILRLSRGVFEVLATGGDSALGGDDFDHAIAEWLRQQVGMSESLNPTEQRILLETAKAAKEELTDSESVEIEILDWSGVLSRDVMDTLIDDLLNKTIRACRRSLRDAEIAVDKIDTVVLVGGSTRTLRVRDKVAEFFGVEPLTNLDPDRVVALGAALQAEVLIGNKSGDEMLLLDVIPLSLGIETMGGLIEKIIHRNTTIPVAKAQEFTTFKDGQTAMAVHILQGERELVDDCRSLARFELRGIPPMVAGAAKIRVTYQVDADGLLSVTARELTSNVESRIEVKPSYGLAEDEITQMLQDSFSHARDDMQARVLREQQVDADRMIQDLLAALKEDGDKLLNTEEIQCLQVAVKELQKIRVETTEHRVLARQIEAVGKTSETFAARRMDASIKSALAGHSLDEIEQG
ncbi:MAG: Fe-S protein assembly chaperone HscA [Porticoccaceae bacterium]|nr:Fe-S protein assembly chaperone HscA [Porticoccaceae bacterium]MBT3798675.1 Fe-S protein assembly chaperone HscA [Porticoccaceae bacterium]MBT4163737.1 Fe-S protein assembly chaperone HscA [Porticoccaceae bacterium]MBT6423116.1 Fe-S protein assembly chaperone HscA [Porticoccaceae bacterium]MBT6693348.1 Fe-S protein assembly chaperone HscA [Porticoccaceae bacterium]